MRNLLTMLQATVDAHPGRDALIWKEDQRWHRQTYTALWHEIGSLAHSLIQLGVAPQSKVALLSTNRPEWTIADFAILFCGAISVPIYPTSTAQQIGFILADSDVEILFAETRELAERAKAAAPAHLRCIILFESSASSGSDSPEEAPSCRDYRELVAAGDELHKIFGTPRSYESVGEHEIATICYTSGTTGPPKGVMLTHHNLIWNIEQFHHYLPVLLTDTTLSHLPLSHIFERTCGQFTILFAGGAIAYAEDMAKVAQNIAEIRPTLLLSVPRFYEKVYASIINSADQFSFFKRLLFRAALRIGKQHQQRKSPFTSLLRPLFDRLVFAKVRAKLGGNLRLLVAGGAALPPHLAEFFLALKLPISEGYGLTETSPVIATNPIDQIRIGTVGRPLPDLQVKTAEDGEILVKGPSVMVGYYKNEEATRAAFDEQGWFRTGDIGVLEAGYLRIVERKKNILVLTTGKNVAPFPIESALAQSAFISQAILFGDGRKYVTALIVPDFAQLKLYCEGRDLPVEIPDLLTTQAVHELYAREIEQALRAFAPFEIPKRFALLPRELTLEAGELTATLKVRTHVLLARHRELIESMYDSGEKKADNLSSM